MRLHLPAFVESRRRFESVAALRGGSVGPRTLLRPRTPLAIVALGLASLVAPVAAAQDDGYVGSDLYRMYCASCHGTSGKGDGPIASSLRYAPPDLSTLKKRSEGKWDAEKVRRIIDGRQPVKGHGGADMPVWGDAFKHSREGFSEEKVRARIEALAGYLAELQVN